MSIAEDGLVAAGPQWATAVPSPRPPAQPARAGHAPARAGHEPVPGWRTGHARLARDQANTAHVRARGRAAAALGHRAGVIGQDWAPEKLQL